MIIISKNLDSINNTEHIMNIFKGADGCKIQVTFTNGSGCQIARYSTPAEAQTAFEMLATAMLKDITGFSMPSDETVKAEMLKTIVPKHRAENGKKTVRRGGS